MGLAVTGKGLCGSPCQDWVTLKKRRSAYDPTKGLFGPALERMLKNSTQREQEGEVFELCLPRK